MASNPIPPANPGYRPTGVVDMDGNPYEVRTTSARQNGNPGHGDGGGGGAVKLTLPDLRVNVALLNTAALLFMTALVTMFLWMIDRIDDKFDDVMKPLQQLQQSVAKQEAITESVDDKLDGLLDRKENDGKQSGNSEPISKGQ
jgi:hypothetical protein